MLLKVPKNIRWVLCHLSTVRNQENYENTLGNRHQGSASCGFSGRDQKPLDRNGLDSTEYGSWEDVQHHCPHKLIKKKQNPKYAVIIGDCRNPIRPLQWVRFEFIPTFLGHRDDDNCYCGPYLRGTKVTPWVTLLWGSIWWIHSWIFTTSEYLMATDRAFPGDPSGW